MKKGMLFKSVPFLLIVECLDYLGDERMSDDVFVFEEDGLYTFDILREFYTFQES